MFEIKLLPQEFWDPIKEEFINMPAMTLKMEHSLASVSRWERKWKKPYLTLEPKTDEEFYDYLRCMTITPKDVPTIVYRSLPQSIIDEAINYINDPMTATTFPKDNRRASREIITAEIIYYQMFSLNIPLECEKWHLNRLMTQIRVCAVKNSPKKKMSRRETMSQNAALNAQRRKARNSKG
jgi:hypothetical protein